MSISVKFLLQTSLICVFELILAISVVSQDGFQLLTMNCYFLDLCVGVLLPQDLDKDTVNGFRDILKELAELRDQAVSRELSREEQTKLGAKIASFLIKGNLNSFSLRKRAFNFLYFSLNACHKKGKERYRM
jgi:hypothetical protein